MNKYENELDKILLDILIASKEINIKLWLEAGTLLGCERENNYIPWEKDLDLGVWGKDFTKKKYILFKKILENKNYLVTKKFNNSNNLITIRKFNLNCSADIAIYTKKGNFAYFKLKPIPIHTKGKFFKRIYDIIKTKNILDELKFHKFGITKIIYILFHYIFTYFATSNLINNFIKYLKKKISRNSKDISWHVPLKFLKKIKKKKFRNLFVYVPVKSIDYLKFRYGKTWKKPRSDWNQFREDKTMLGLK